MTTTSDNASNAEKLLIVDADKMMCELLQYKFENEGFAVSLAHDKASASAMPLGEYQIFLIDLMDADATGIRFVKELRKNNDTRNTPIIIMSAQDGEDTVVDALGAGADDYIAKPFSTRILVARIRSILRRRRMVSARRMSNIMNYKNLSVDLTNATVTVDGSTISLTRTEYLILAMFLRHRNQFFDRAEIIHEAWEDDISSERAVDTNISRLRKKIGEYGRQIINRQGFGYGFVD
ncbi:MAG: response regulator transcription factor [Muribaculaceae bacterium]|jgi:two-component system phosphate regulon response regulator PhoB|nr:response regulator transcription factor [Muribaculaceae bacterium]